MCTLVKFHYNVSHTESAHCDFAKLIIRVYNSKPFHKGFFLLGEWPQLLWEPYFLGYKVHLKYFKFLKGGVTSLTCFFFYYA